MKKKDIPISILKALKSFSHLQGTKFDIRDSASFLINIVDLDESSSFHFIVEQFQNQNGKFKILINVKPKSQNEVIIDRLWIETKNLEVHFKNWLDLLEEYDNVSSFFDDPILKSFTEDYYAEFEIIDDNAEKEPLKPKQILLLDKHLEFIENNIEKYQTEKNEVNIKEIKENISDLRDNLTSKSKAWVIQNLSIIWGKLTKEGPKFLKEFLSESKKHAIKEGVKFLIEQGTDLIN